MLRHDSALQFVVISLTCVSFSFAEETLGHAVVPEFLEAHCTSCHRGEKAKAELDLASLSTSSFSHAESQTVSEADADRWVRVIGVLRADLMPPPRKSRPDARAKVQVLGSIEALLRRAGVAGAYFRKLELPEFGNHVDHETLFSGEIETPPFSPPRLWRMSPYIFEARRRVGRVKGIQNPFSFSTPATGIRDYSATGHVDSSTVDTILLNAKREIDSLFQQAGSSAKNKKRGRRRPNPFSPFLRAKGDLSNEELEAPIRSVFERLVSRSPSADELERYVGFFKKNLRDTGDPRASLETTLQAIYLSPEAIYRMEWGLGPNDEHGRRRLSAEETAYSLSYALFDKGPKSSRALQSAMEAGTLRSREEVAQVVRSVLKGEAYRPIGGRAKNSAPRLLRFFREFFGYHRAVEVFKDAERVASQDIYHDARKLVADADNLIKVILRNDRHVFEELLTTRNALVFHNGDNEALIERHERLLAELKGFDEEQLQREVKKRKAGVLKKPKYKNNPKLVPGKMAEIDRWAKTAIADKRREYETLVRNGVSLKLNRSRQRGYVKAYNLNFRSWTWPAKQPFELPAEERAGILTHPAWLVAHSFNDGNDPVHRGIWVYSRLLAGVVPDLPPDVDARIPEDPHKTLRERLDVVREKRCWSCHRKFNPLGEAFETFDDFGRFRREAFFDAEKKLVTQKRVRSSSGDWERVDFEGRVKAGEFTAKPVDARGSYSDLALAEFEGEFENGVDLMRRIGRSTRARQSMIRHLFRFLLGRNERLSDSRTLVEADRAYVESQGSFKELVVSLLSSDSFLYRR